MNYMVNSQRGSISWKEGRRVTARMMPSLGWTSGCRERHGGGLRLCSGLETNLKLQCAFSLPSGKLEAWGGGRSVSTKADSSGQCPKNFYLLILHKSVFPRVICCYGISAVESYRIIPLLSVCLNVGKKIPLIWNSCLMPAILPHSSVWAGLLCAVHIFRMAGFQAFRASVFKSAGERRQQSSAGWCLPKCGLITE